MLIDILKGLTVVALYIAVIAGGIAFAGLVHRRRQRRAQGDRK